MDVYRLRDHDSDLEDFLAFAVYNPARENDYLVPDRMVIPKKHGVITLGVECDAFLNPVIVFECFGEGSDFLARSDKIETYRAFPSIQQYVALVARETPYVEQHTRVGTGWEIRVGTSLDDHIQLIDGKTLPLSQIFRSSW